MTLTLQVDSQDELRKMEDFVCGIVNAGPEIRRHLINFSPNYSKRNIYQEELQDYILGLLFKFETDKDNLGTLVINLCRECLDRPTLKSYLLSLEEKMTKNRFHLLLCEAAWMEPRFADVLANWIQTDNSVLAFGATKKFLDNIRTGMSPRDAAYPAFKFTIDNSTNSS